MPSLSKCLGLAAALALGALAAQAENVVTYHNTPDRAGAYVVPGLTKAAAAGLHPDTGFHAVVTGNVYAQPLYWQPSPSKTGLLIVATGSNLVYGLNANNGVVVWQRKLPAPAPRSALPCGNLDPEGITGTPVIDPATGTLYLDAQVLAPGNVPRHRIFALSAATGRPLAGWPVDVQSQMHVRGLTFASSYQGERSALQFVGGRIYVVYAGRAGDCGRYRGTVIEVTPSTRTISGAWMTRAVRGGIWAQGGAASDGTSIFATTGNTSGTATWGDGEAVIRLRQGLRRSGNAGDYYTPANWADLDAHDRDLGGTAAVPLTVPLSPSGTGQRVLALGKDGYAYLLDGADLGGIGHELYKLQISSSRIVTAPAIYNTATATLAAVTNNSTVTPDCSGGNLMVLKITSDPATPIAPLWCSMLSGSGSPILTTTDGSAEAIFWVTGAEGDNLLHGFNALTGDVVFSGTGTAMTGLHRYGTLIAANHRLYVAADGTVFAFTF
jgi:hypothetical protein